MESVITSIGSLTEDGGVGQIATTLEDATQTDLKTISAENSSENKSGDENNGEEVPPMLKRPEEKNNTNIAFYAGKTEPMTPFGSGEQANNLVTPKVQIKKFGI